MADLAVTEPESSCVMVVIPGSNTRSLLVSDVDARDGSTRCGTFAHRDVSRPHERDNRAGPCARMHGNHLRCYAITAYSKSRSITRTPYATVLQASLLTLMFRPDTNAKGSALLVRCVSTELVFVPPPRCLGGIGS